MAHILGMSTLLVMGLNTFYGPYLEGSQTYLVSTAQRWGYQSINMENRQTTLHCPINAGYHRYYLLLPSKLYHVL